MAEPAQSSRAPDPTHYPVSEKVPEQLVNREIADTLKRLVERRLAERGQKARVGSDQFIYWVQYAPTRTVAPDLYVLPGVAPDTVITAWKVWETGVVPSLAVEVVGLDVRKDYELAPGRYDELGVQELIVYDPRSHESPERVRFQVWRRRRGSLVRALWSDADRVRSAVLGCFLREVGQGASLRLRVATGRHGELLLPTAEEAEEAERAARDAAERGRDAAERGRDAAERERSAERAARDAAEKELARLRAELDELRKR